MKNKIQFVILGLLMDFPMNGYQIKKTLELSTANFQKISYGNIYPTLKKLEKEGYIESFHDIENNTPKIIYKINDSGFKYFKKWLLSPTEDLQFGHNHLMALFFYKHLTAEERKTKTKYLINFYHIEVQKLKRLKDEVCDLADSYQMATLEYGIKVYEFNINFYNTYLSKGEINHG